MLPLSAREIQMIGALRRLLLGASVAVAMASVQIYVDVSTTYNGGGWTTGPWNCTVGECSTSEILPPPNEWWNPRYNMRIPWDDRWLIGRHVYPTRDLMGRRI
jgi:hypothetical protein